MRASELIAGAAFAGFGVGLIYLWRRAQTSAAFWYNFVTVPFASGAMAAIVALATTRLLGIN